MTTDKELLVGNDVPQNPFEITKAVDFTDEEIDATWVDWPAPGGFAAWMDVKSPMARIIRGGKGSGRTHIMRYFSAQVQAVRGLDDPLEQVLKDGVLGIYVLCSGLNSSRFRGRGHNEDTWESIFPHFADVWLAQAALAAFAKLTAGDPPSEGIQRAICDDIRKLLNGPFVNSGDTIAALSEDLFKLQGDIDRAVNNAGLNPAEPLNVVIRSSPGELVFGVPNALRSHYQPLRDVRFLYLIDEFENFEKPQQRYINTLVREKAAGTSFMIGVRTYGLRTLSTLSAGEENKHGSEFEEIRPDRNYAITDRRKYGDFCLQVVERRLARCGLIEETRIGDVGKHLEGFFEVPGQNYEERLIADRFDGRERPYLARLRRQLSRFAGTTGQLNLDSEHVELIINAARVPSRPLLEKVNCFLLYRAWASGENLIETANRIADERTAPDRFGIVLPNPEQRDILYHYVTDLKDQLLRDLGRSPNYAGIKTFIELSDGLPRNLIVILKNIYRWGLFNGDSPFREGQISLGSQRQGVLEATDWFLADAKPLGPEGEYVNDAIHRLGEIFRKLRFSDKLVECSAASFNADLTNCSARAREIIKIAEEHSLLVRAAQGRKKKSTGLVEAKFHLNRLLSPRWDLPIARRGAVELNPEEINAIFDPQESNRFNELVNRRTGTLDAPFMRHRDEDLLQQRFEFPDY
jgi:hypothetical protein